MDGRGQYVVYGSLSSWQRWCRRTSISWGNYSLVKNGLT